MKNRHLRKLQRGHRLRDGRCLDGLEGEIDLKTRWLIENIYGTSKPPTRLPAMPYAGCFTPGTNTSLTKPPEGKKGN